MLYKRGLDITSWAVSYGKTILTSAQSIFMAFNIGYHLQSRHSTYNVMLWEGTLDQPFFNTLSRDENLHYLQDNTGKFNFVQLTALHWKWWRINMSEKYVFYMDPPPTKII